MAMRKNYKINNDRRRFTHRKTDIYTEIQVYVHLHLLMRKTQHNLPYFQHVLKI